MATLYFNAAVDSDWNELGNWWEELNGVDGGTSDVAASALPTSSDDVVLLATCDTNSGSSPTIVDLEVRTNNIYISIDITVTGLATFTGELTGSVSGTITGNCTFTGSGAYNTGSIIGDADFIYPAAPSLYGSVSGTATRTGYTDLYFKNVSTDGSWNNGNNWFVDEACLYNAWTNNGPWTSDDMTKDLNLHRGSDSVTAEDAITIDADIGNGFIITGECDIGVIGNSSLSNTFSIYSGTFTGVDFTNSGYIYDGAFVGDNFFNAGSIYGGTYSGDYFSNNSGNIYGGTYSGDYFSNNSGNIYGGTYSGDNFSNNSYIYGGTFSGGYSSNNNDIFGGTYSGEYFSNYGYIYGGTYSGEYFSNSSNVNGGTFSGDNFSNGGNVNGGFWLESGSMDVAQYEFDGSSHIISDYIRITGNFPNPSQYNNGSGFMTLRISGQDVLGGGLI
jgi:hypothetical protein